MDQATSIGKGGSVSGLGWVILGGYFRADLRWRFIPQTTNRVIKPRHVSILVMVNSGSTLFVTKHYYTPTLTRGPEGAGREERERT